jgi:hypothetical protein
MEFLRPDEHFVLHGAGRSLDRATARRRGRQTVERLGWSRVDRRPVRELSGRHPRSGPPGRSSSTRSTPRAAPQSPQASLNGLAVALALALAALSTTLATIRLRHRPHLHLTLG